MNCKLCAGESKPLYQKLFDDRYGYPGTFDLYQCTVCGFAQTVPELSAEQLTQLYTDYYPRKQLTAADVQQAAKFRPGWTGWLAARLRGTLNTCHYYAKPGQRVLDVGCGDGTSLLDITQLGAEAYGTEYDRNVEPVAKQLGLRIFFGDLKAAPYPDEFFDTITMSQLLEHVADPVAFIRTAKQKLKPGGQMMISFPNINSFNRKKSGRRWVNWHVPYHINFFTNQSIALLAKATAMELSSVHTYTPNQWLLLQTLANHHAPVLGQPSPVWVGGMAKWRLGLALLYSLVRIPLTRIQDAMGQGDSYLVILTAPRA